jgi:hypothetical protein
MRCRRRGIALARREQRFDTPLFQPSRSRIIGVVPGEPARVVVAGVGMGVGHPRVAPRA